jgi:molybdenum cofactor guanylyltransferase
VTGVVLAGGRSSRFGRDKLVEPYQGAPMLHHVVARVAEVSRELVVVIAPDAEVPSTSSVAPVRFVRDAEPAQGPLAGVVAGLAATQTELAVLAGGDMPDLQVPVLRELLRVADEASALAVALLDGDRLPPLPSVVRVADAREVAASLLASGERRLRALLVALDVRVLDEATWVALDPERRTLFDVDEVGDLER